MFHHLQFNSLSGCDGTANELVEYQSSSASLRQCVGIVINLLNIILSSASLQQCVGTVIKVLFTYIQLAIAFYFIYQNNYATPQPITL